MAKKPTEKQDKPRKKSRVWRLIKIAIYIILFFVLIFTVMTKMGGNSDILKGAVEDFLTDSSGYPAKIGTLNRMTFFPNISIDIEDIKMKTREEGDPSILVQKARVSLGFFDVMLGNGKVRLLDVRGVTLAPGVVAPQPVYVEYFSILREKQQEQTPSSLPVVFLGSQGRIGATPFHFRLNVQESGSSYNPKYTLEKEGTLEADLGDIVLKGTAGRQEFGGLVIDDFTLSRAQNPLASGQLYLSRNKAFNIKGTVKLAGHETILEPDIQIGKEGSARISGFLKSPAFYAEDFVKGSPLRLLIKDLKSIFEGAGNKAQEDLDLTGLDMDVTLNLGNIYAGTLNLGSLNAPLQIKAGTLNIGDMTGGLSSGNIEGSISLKPGETALDLDVALNVHGLDYGALQKQIRPDAAIDGKADMALRLSSTGKTRKELVDALNGDFMVIGGAGRFESGALNLEKGGLVRALMPHLKAEENLAVNCAVMDLKIKAGMAKMQTLFVDGAHARVAGTGSYDIGADALDMVLESEPKDAAIRDESAAVNVRGSVFAPEFTPRALGLEGKEDGPLPDKVSPALWAFSLADLGLNDNHPCARFMEPEHSEENAQPSAAKE